MKARKIKAIHIRAKEWFDKFYGNSYFSARITVELRNGDDIDLVLPFQYGYGQHYQDVAHKKIQEELSCLKGSWLYALCQKNNIKLHSTKIENCLKRDVKEWGMVSKN